MKQVSVTDPVEAPDGVRISQTKPVNGASVNLYKTATGNWCAQHWFRTDAGQLVANYTEEQSSKSAAMDAAFDIAADEDIPFVSNVRSEENAMDVESTIIE